MNTFRVWAPYARSAVHLEVDDRSLAMAAEPGGWWRAVDPVAGPGSRYAFRLDGGPDELPDPRSRYQPDGVHARSALVAPYDGWTDAAWPGRPLAGGVLYELHVGTFTPEGTFDAAVAKLPYLAELGITAVEVLPVAAVAGSRNWGYDGVGLYAVSAAYGGPDGLDRFVDAAHAAGLAVILDVVYNHLGPSGNYLPLFGPYFSARATPWGATVNLDGPGSDAVRSFIVDNALMWLREHHLDGLRLDAVHALHDQRATHILEELAAAVDGLAAELGRPLALIAESDLNDPRIVTSREAGGYGMTAQWCDDVHHALHATLTGERQGYYVDFGPLPVLAKALTRAFVHDGTYSTFRQRHHGRPVGDLPGERFVAFLQDHDQVGNRARGDRISATLDPALLRVGAALLLCSPYTPMLFMGEEWGARTPWQFFCDPDSPELAAATREGRRQEFAGHGWAPGDVPDPVAPETFAASKLDWSEPERDEHRHLLAWYRALIALRKAEPELHSGDRSRTSVVHGDDWLVLRRGSLAVVAALASGSREIPLPEGDELLLASARCERRGDGTVLLAGPAAAVFRMSH